MTSETLHRLVRNIANRAHVRYWMHWNAPCEFPVLMAISVLDFDGQSLRQDDLEYEYGMKKDFAWEKNGVWTVERTNGDGKLWRNLL